MFLRAVLFLVFIFYSNSLLSQESTSSQERNQQIRWDLTDLYTGESEWQSAFDETRLQIGQLESLKGTLGKSAKSLAKGLNQISAVRKSFYRVYVYASLINDEDQRVAESQERVAKARALSTEFGEAVSWLAPELINLGEKKLNKYLKKEPDLAPFDFYLSDLIRNIPHRLDEKGESMLAAAGSLLEAPNEIYELLVNADVPWPEVKLSTGETVFIHVIDQRRTGMTENGCLTPSGLPGTTIKTAWVWC